MSEQPLDAQGEAREALSSVVRDYGQRILGDPRMLDSQMSYLIPGLPRERNLLIAAARADVAGDLARHVQEQHLDPDTAVQMVSRALAERQAVDPASSAWVTTQYARALGYPLRSDAPPQPGPTPPGPTPPGPTPPAPETVIAYPQHGSPYQHTAPQQDPGAGSAGGYPAYSPPQPPAGGYPGHAPPQAPAGGYPGYAPPPQPGGGQPPTAVAPPGPPPWQQPTTRPPERRNRGLIYGLGAAAAAVVILVAVAFGAGLFKSGPASTPTPTTPHPTSPRPTPTVNPLAAGVAPLVQLLPEDVNAARCKPPPKASWATPGLVTALSCPVSALPNGGILAYQMNSSANYQATLANFNTWWAFGPPSGASCPPSGQNTQGEEPWSDTGSGGKGWFPTASGQIFECGYLGTNDKEPAYVWAFPTEDAFIIAYGTTFSNIVTWLADYGDPAASPKPVTP